MHDRLRSVEAERNIWRARAWGALIIAVMIFAVALAFLSRELPS
jgi:hypothetical protein